MRGAGKISRFKLPILYLKFPGLSQVDTIKEMPAVKPEEPKK